MIMPISFIPYPLPKPSQWLTLTPWFSKSPPSSPPLPSSSSSSPRPNPSSASMSSRPSPPVVILLPSPVTTTATSIKTPEMTQVRQHAMVAGGTFVSPSSDTAQVEVAQSSGGSDGREDELGMNEMTLSSTRTRMENRLETVNEKSLKQDDVVWLFDLKSARGAVPWHPNTWKIRYVALFSSAACLELTPERTRLALNYKQIPYKTIWLTYPSMEPVLKQLGVPPMQRNRTGKAHYSVPVIVDWRVPSIGAGGGGGGGGQHQEELWAVSGSERILDYLDGTYTATPTMTTTTAHTSRSRKSKSQSPPPSSIASASTSRSHSHPPSSSSSSSRHTSHDSYSSPTSASSSSSISRRPRLLQSMFDSMVERVLDPPFWKMILPLAWIGGVLDEESKAYFLEVRGYPGGLVADNNIDNAAQTNTNTNTTVRTKKWNPERHVTSRDWDALREGFETIAAFCEMYGIGVGGVAKGQDSSSGEERERKQNSDPDSTGSLVLTRVEIVLIAYLAALHECVSIEKWVEVRDIWCSGMWGVLWDRSARVRVNAECL